MSHKMKTLANEAAQCEKYLSRMLRQENMYPSKRTTPKPYQEKFSHLMKQPVPVQPQRAKPKVNIRQQSPPSRTCQVPNGQKDQGDNASRAREHPKKHKHRSVTESRSESREREAWGQILQSNKSREKVSSFSNFDPLRTLHFLSKELYTKLQSIMPEDDVLQMVADIQHALKRIPPEVSSLLHNPQLEYPQSEPSGYTLNTSTKTCQTPPTLYQEDTEKFQKIMEENTYRLEASCKQLEVVCTNLQSEKEMTEKELDDARENVEFLCKRVKDLEDEMEEITHIKIKQLEAEKQHLQKELNRAMQEVNDNPTMNSLRKLVEELKKQKTSSDEMCARLEYDMTLLKMEKEKFVTMLAVRDREIKEIQEEMAKIQDQVGKQLRKLNGEVIKRVNSMKQFTDPYNGFQENMFLEFGDTTISSITTNESDREPVIVCKESPCGDAEVTGIAKESQENMLQKCAHLKANNVEMDLPDYPNNKEQDMVFEDLLKGLTPSVKALLASHNL